MTTTTPRLALSAGDPAGIGPDVLLALSKRAWSAELVVIADAEMLASRAAALDLILNLVPYEPGRTPTPQCRGELWIEHVPLAAPAIPGKADPLNGGVVLQCLERAARGCESGEFDALVTAPVSKAVISDSGTAFSGHTEFLAELTGADHVVMLLAAQEMRVALATTHLPLAEVPGAITADRLRQTLRILHDDLQNRFGIEQPRISVLGLNPHAGESGKLGLEEIQIIIPVMEELRGQGMQLTGPLPADTAFGPAIRESTDAYLAMYHDQGLPVLKFASFGNAVNITLGLPIIRTSVDHGTAFDIAGTGDADGGSMEAAVSQAIALANRSV